MPIQNIPEIFLPLKSKLPDLLVYDFKMTADVVKDKVDLSLNMFSFLQSGQKQVHFANTAVAVNPEQSLIIEKGNCLFTELLHNENTYYCKLLFFSNQKLIEFITKFNITLDSKKVLTPKTSYFVIENDDYIKLFVASLSAFSNSNLEISNYFLNLKFEEIMLYLYHKYDTGFIAYIQSLLAGERQKGFNTVVESNKLSNLSLEEMAFLCNMSLSTFKRHFINNFKTAPGRWFQQQRLNRAKEILQTTNKKPSEIFLDFGYENLSNFSTAFKNEFGINLRDI